MNVGEIICNPERKICYKIIKTLRGGGQAEIAYAVSDRSDKVYFIKRLLSIKYTPRTKIACEKFYSERQSIYKKINSSTLPKASCSLVADFFREKSFYYVVYERIVAAHFNSDEISKGLSLNDKLLLFKIIAYSLIPFERNNIVHSDLKPENILYKVVGNHIVAKLIDYESSFFEDTPPAKGNIIGTEPYYSPEIALYNNEENNISSEHVSFKSDIFSLGVIFLELLEGKYPTDISKQYIYERVLRGQDITITNNVPEDLKVLILRMLDKEPNKRPNILEILLELDQCNPSCDSQCQILNPHYVLEYNVDNVKLHLYSLNGANIYYSLGSEFKKYTSPFIIDTDVSIIYYAFINGIKSEKINETISIYEKHGKVSKPIISHSGRAVTISCATTNSEIYYTIDGTEPTRHSHKYEGEFTLTSDCRIKAIAVCVGKYDSPVSTIHTASKTRIS